MSARRPTEGRSEAPESVRQPAVGGTAGWLRLKAVRRGEVIEHEGAYRYVGVVGEQLAFAPATEDPVAYLHEHEVVEFKPIRGEV